MESEETPENVLAFLQKIEDNTLRVAVIGLGYVGLPLAVTLSEVGFSVTGIDKNRELLNRLGMGESSIPSVPGERLKKTTLKFSETLVDEYDVYVICVPTPLDQYRRPDMGPVNSVVKAIDKALWLQDQPEHAKLVVLESTVWPGATQELVESVILCSDTYFAFAPERENPGDEKFNTRNIPRVVGSDSDNGGIMACAFYRTITEVHPVSSTRVAESAKLVIS